MVCLYSAEERTERRGGAASVRNKVVNCYATVRQVGDKFERGEMPHKHPGEPGLSLKKKINLEVSQILKLLLRVD